MSPFRPRRLPITSASAFTLTLLTLAHLTVHSNLALADDNAAKLTPVGPPAESSMGPWRRLSDDFMRARQVWPIAPHALPANGRVTNSPDAQNETSVAVDFNRPFSVVAGFNDYSVIGTGYGGNGVAYSTDGGTTFSHSPTGVPLPAGFSQSGGDPALAFDAEHRVYYAHIALQNPTDPLRGNNGIFVARSDNGGATWNASVPVVRNFYDGATPVNFEDKEYICIDTNAGSPYLGRIYVSWTRFYAGNYPGTSNLGGSDIMLSHSDDGGNTWSTPLRLTAPASLPGNGDPGTVVQGSEPAVSVGGRVYVAFHQGPKTTAVSCLSPNTASCSVGDIDNFGTPDPAHPSPALRSALPICQTITRYDERPARDCSNTPTNGYFAETIVGCWPANKPICSAIMTIAFKLFSGEYIDPGAEQLYLYDGSARLWAGYVSSLATSAGDGYTITLDLKALPTDDGPLDISSSLHDGELSVVLETYGADYVAMTVTYDPVSLIGRAAVMALSGGGTILGPVTYPFGTAGTDIHDADNSPNNGRQLPGWAFRVNAFPNVETGPYSRPGDVYVVACDDPDETALGDGSNILFARSTDYGVSWEPVRRLNTDTGIAHQIFPWMAVNRCGDIEVIWYDGRNAPGGDGLDVYGATSSNGGFSFEPNFRVTDQTFSPNTGQFVGNSFFGDYNGLGAGRTDFHLIWTDGRNGEQEIYHDNSGPVLHFSFDNISVNFDDAGRGHHGIVGAATVVGGHCINSLQFHPNNDMQDFYVPHANDLNITGAMTGIAWIRPQGQQSTDNNPGCPQGTIFSKGGNYWLQIAKCNNEINYQHEGSGLIMARVATTIPLNVWSQVAFTRSADGHRIKLFRNGQRLLDTTLTSIPTSNAEILMVGNYGFGNSYSTCEFNGRIDEIKLFNRTLSDGELASEYCSVEQRCGYGGPATIGSPVELPTDGLKKLRVIPNPFANRVAVRLTLQATGRVDAAVYDVMGRRVRSLASGVFAPGSRTIGWDGCGDDGLRVAEAMYLIRVDCDGSSYTEKVVHVRNPAH